MALSFGSLRCSRDLDVPSSQRQHCQGITVILEGRKGGSAPSLLFICFAQESMKTATLLHGHAALLHSSTHIAGIANNSISDVQTHTIETFTKSTARIMV